MKLPSLIALNGDQWSTPASTINACWAALGAGAKSLYLNIYLTKDHVPVCTPAEKLQPFVGENYSVSNITFSELSELDAGYAWRSTVLDSEGQTTGERGEDTPWRQGTQKKEGEFFKKYALYYPSLSEVLQVFGRRCPIYLELPGEDYKHKPVLIDNVLAELETTGLVSNIALIGALNDCEYIKDKHSDARVGLDFRKIYTQQKINVINHLNSSQNSYTCDFFVDDISTLLSDPLVQAPTGIAWLLVNNLDSLVPKRNLLNELLSLDINLLGLVISGVKPTQEQLVPNSVIFSDTFAGQTLDQKQWAIGYSHDNDDTTLSIDNGFIVQLKQGGHYSGGAIVTKVPLHGNFDIEVDFQVDAPHQGTTFEVAAICIDPGYHKINLTFDVHGAPPYASSERDQDDGFRCGWNNSFNITAFDHWKPSSANLYNNYGRDVGYGKVDSPNGTLRLTRNGAIFNSYYRDKFNRGWVGSGSMLVHNMAADCFIRLAAKHWKKKNPEPPANRVVFNNFVIRQS